MELSVIIPTYNRLWSLPKAVESCRGGALNVEIIVVDDGSDDGTWEWLMTQHDIVSFRQDNGGKDWAVNRAFAAAQGEYIRFLDSDDWLVADANDKQLQIARSSNADVVVAGYQVHAEDEAILRTNKWTQCDDFIAQQLGECDSSHYSAYLFRREFIKNSPHRPEYIPLDDRLFVIEVAMAKPVVAVMDGLALCHRHHSKGRLQFPKGMRAVASNLHHITLYKKCLRKLEETGELTLRRRKAACKVLWPLAHWTAYSHIDEACEVADWVYQLDPDFSPPEAGLLGRLYATLGFRTTEIILKLRRILFSPFR